MAALKLNTGISASLMLGQFYYHDTEHWSMVCGVYKDMIAAYSFYDESPRLFYQNKDSSVSSLNRKYIKLDCRPVIVRNSHLFRIGDTIYFKTSDTIEIAEMGFHCDGGKISILYNGRFEVVDRKHFFKVSFI